jgi:hypothetical protein
MGKINSIESGILVFILFCVILSFFQSAGASSLTEFQDQLQPVTNLREEISDPSPLKKIFPEQPFSEKTNKFFILFFGLSFSWSWLFFLSVFIFFSLIFLAFPIITIFSLFSGNFFSVSLRKGVSFLIKVTFLVIFFFLLVITNISKHLAIRINNLFLALDNNFVRLFAFLFLFLFIWIIFIFLGKVKYSYNSKMIRKGDSEKTEEEVEQKLEIQQEENNEKIKSLKKDIAFVKTEKRNAEREGDNEKVLEAVKKLDVLFKVLEEVGQEVEVPSSKDLPDYKLPKRRIVTKKDLKKRGIK